MLQKAVYLLLTVTILQVPAEFIQPEFIEDVIKSESEAAKTEDAANRIVSGWEAIPGQHPHHASLRMVGPSGGVSACGGSFVHREWVITAAHCTAQRVTIVVRGGVVDIARPEYIFETTVWWNYPTYDDNNVAVVQPNDICLLKLQRRITYTRYLKAIRIQRSTDSFRDYDGEMVHASGHGRTWTDGLSTEVLRWVYLRAVSNSNCAATFGQIITANTICARWFNVTSQSTCQGDSGGPLVHVGPDGVETLIGVTSFVAGSGWGCHSGLPAGFIRPGPFLSWFEEVTGIDFENLQEDEEDTTTTTTSTTTPPTPPTPPPKPPKPPKPTPPESGEEESDEEGSGSSEEDNSSECSESDEDGDMSEILKRLQIKVKVKVAINKFKKPKKPKK